MTSWTRDELNKIGNAEELQIASLQRDGTLRKPTTIWVVRVDDDLYVRSVYGRGSAWFRGTQVLREGRIRAGGIDKDVSFVEETDPEVNEQIDDAYRTKYRRYASSIVNTTLTSEARAATIKLVPRFTSSYLSVVWLGEKVGLRRWLALIFGFIGVLLIVKPGSGTFNLGSIFVLIATLFYALSIMVTRKLQTTDSSATMAYYSSLVYLLISFILAPLASVVGEIPDAHPSIAFLFRSWIMPTLLDWVIMSGLGLVWAGGMYFIARAYSLAPASVVAPFEYTPLLFNVMWGFFLWHEIPTLTTLAGAFLTLSSGIYILYRERVRTRVGQVSDEQSRSWPIGV